MSLHSPLTRCGDAIDDDDDAPTCTLHYIQRRLGRTDFKLGRFARYVSLLIADRGFPPPLPDMVKGQLVETVTERSRWLRPAVEAWLGEFLPPDNAAQVDRAAMQAAAADMDDAARNLGGRHLRLVAGGRL